VRERKIKERGRFARRRGGLTVSVGLVKMRRMPVRVGRMLMGRVPVRVADPGLGPEAEDELSTLLLLITGDVVRRSGGVRERRLFDGAVRPGDRGAEEREQDERGARHRPVERGGGAASGCSQSKVTSSRLRGLLWCGMWLLLQLSALSRALFVKHHVARRWYCFLFASHTLSSYSDQNI